MFIHSYGLYIWLVIITGVVMNCNYYVLLGDVVMSRQIPDREAFQTTLHNACVKASDLYRNDFLAEIKILKGADEIGGVLYSWKEVYNIMDFILKEVYPYQIRFSLVKGLVDVGADSGNVANMDGPAFHLAAEEISTLKNNGLMFSMSTENKDMDRSIATQVCFILLLRQYWNARQYAIVLEYSNTISQKAVAEKLGISQQAVSKSLIQTKWKQYQILEKSILEQFEKYGQRG